MPTEQQLLWTEGHILLYCGLPALVLLASHRSVEEETLVVPDIVKGGEVDVVLDEDSEVLRCSQESWPEDRKYRT